MNDRSSKSHVYSSKSAYRLFLRVYSKMEMSISALGHKRTLQRILLMSALPPKADMVQPDRDVRFVPKADIGLLLLDLFVATE